MQNTYLIAINVTNKQKERYYHEYVPELLDVRSFPAANMHRQIMLTRFQVSASTGRIASKHFEQRLDHRCKARKSNIDPITATGTAS
jgi:hypothetical protein